MAGVGSALAEAVCARAAVVTGHGRRRWAVGLREEPSHSAHSTRPNSMSACPSHIGNWDGLSVFWDYLTRLRFRGFSKIKDTAE